MSADRLLDLLRDAARGRVDAAHETLLVLPPPPGLAMAVVGLPGFHVVASSASEGWVREQLAADDLMAPTSPAFIGRLSARIGRASSARGATTAGVVAICDRSRHTWPKSLGRV